MAGFTMGLNMLLLIAMVATNILSLYHLSSTTTFRPIAPTHQPVPDHLLRQLNTIRSTINQLTHRQNPTSTSPPAAVTTTVPSDLILHSTLSPIASSCNNHPDLLHRYMKYTPFSLCPLDSDLAESLMLRGCDPLPRRRCFSRTPRNPSLSVPESNVIWSYYSSATKKTNLGSDLSLSKSKLKFDSHSSELDLPISQLLQIAKSANFVFRLGIDIGGGAGSFAAAMKPHNVTVVTTTMNLNAPFNEAVALQGLVPIHVPLQQRLPVFDGVMDLVRCGHAVNRWIPVVMLEFMLFDMDRVLRGGGYLWLDRFFSKRVDLDKVYGPLISKLGYKKVKWAVADKSDPSGLKNAEVYLSALLQKPLSR